MNITEILDVKSIQIGLKVKTKTELFKSIVELAIKSGKITDPVAALQEINTREKILSTGIGQGIALPHAKTNAISDTTGALALLDPPIDYDALDGEPVSIVFLILGRENNVGNHLRLLSKISRILNSDQFRKALLSAKDPNEIIKLFSDFEDKS